MYLIYIDEVKFHAEISPFYWLCALGISEEDVLSVESALTAFAIAHFGRATLDKQTEFHASHIASGKGIYAGTDPQKLAWLLKSLADVISNHGRVARIQVRLDPRKIARNDYANVAFMYLVERADTLLARRKQTGLLIADHDETMVEVNVKSLSEFRQRGTDFAFGRQIRHLVDTIHHTKSHHSRLLQLADVYAYLSFLNSAKDLGEVKAGIVAHIRGLENFCWPTTYKHWPSS